MRSFVSAGGIRYCQVRPREEDRAAESSRSGNTEEAERERRTEPRVSIHGVTGRRKQFPQLHGNRVCLSFSSTVKSLWRPEYAAYMIEGTPGKPYGGLTAHFNVVEANMKYRREEVEEFLEKDEVIMSVTAFPRYAEFSISLRYKVSW